MVKDVIKILQGSAVTENTYVRYVNYVFPFWKFIAVYVRHKNYENRLSHVKVTSEDTVGPFY